MTEPQSPPNPFTLGLRMAGEALLSHVIPASRASLDRTRLLASKLHQVGDIALPLPNLVAAQLIAKLDPGNPLQFVSEALFILLNQTSEDVLFLHGEPRQRAMAVSLRDISIAQIPSYMLAIQDMLAELEKKSLNCLTTTTSLLTALMQQVSSFSSPKSTDSPTATSSSN